MSQTSRMVEPKAGEFVTQKGAYGLRTVAARPPAVRGRSGRCLPEVLGQRPVLDVIAVLGAAAWVAFRGDAGSAFAVVATADDA